MFPVLFIMSALATAQAEWTWRVFDEAGFKILAPISFDHTLTEMPVTGTYVTYHQYKGGQVGGPAPGLAFTIDHYAIPGPSGSTESGFVEDFFENTLEVMLTSLGASLIYSGISGRGEAEVCSWKASYLDGRGIIRGESILAGNKYYGLQVFGLAEQVPEAMMQKFLGSFKRIEISSP